MQNDDDRKTPDFSSPELPPLPDDPLTSPEANPSSPYIAPPPLPVAPSAVAESENPDRPGNPNGPVIYDEDDRFYVKRGQEIDLRKLDPSLKTIRLGIGWDTKSYENEQVDMDGSIFLLDINGQTREDSDFVFYNNLEGCDGAVQHQGDNRTGAGDGDDETAILNLNKIPYGVQDIVFVVSIYDALDKIQDFTMVRNVFIRLVNEETNFELLRFELDEEVMQQTNSTAVLCGCLRREGPKWIFVASVEFAKGGLAEFAKRYGIIVAEDTSI